MKISERTKISHCFNNISHCAIRDLEFVEDMKRLSREKPFLNLSEKQKHRLQRIYSALVINGYSDPNSAVISTGEQSGRTVYTDPETGETDAPDTDSAA